MIDLVVRNALRSTTSGGELVDLAVDDGLIVVVQPAGGDLPPAHHLVDAGGRYTSPGLVESHIHLEKAFLLDRVDREVASLDDAIAVTGELKRGFTAADIATRARRVLDRALRHGVGFLRCHVEVDDVLRMTAMETILGLREEYRHRLTIQVVAFPQEGILRQRDALTFLHKSLAAGADVVGGIPYADDDASAHLDAVFDLAADHGVPIDLHIDFSDDPSRLDVVDVARRTIERGMQGRVTAGHLTALGSLPADQARKVADGLAEAGVSVVCLPLTDVYLNGRGDAFAARRGVTPVRLLREAGVRVAVATNNIQNPFTPFGRGHLLDAATMFAEMGHMGSRAEQHEVFRMVTDVAGEVVGLQGYGFVPGTPGDVVVFDALSEREVLLEQPQLFAAWKGGARYA